MAVTYSREVARADGDLSFRLKRSIEIATERKANQMAQVDGKEMVRCSDCKGAGTIEDTCVECSGTGKVEVDCDTCEGAGEVEKESA